MGTTLTHMPHPEQVLRSAYRAFNARDVEAALELMHLEVDWPNAWEGGRVVGHATIRGTRGSCQSGSRADKRLL